MEERGGGTSARIGTECEIHGMSPGILPCEKNNDCGISSINRASRIRSASINHGSMYGEGVSGGGDITGRSGTPVNIAVRHMGHGALSVRETWRHWERHSV